MPDDLAALTRVLTDADRNRAVDVEMLEALHPDELDYLTHLGDLEDAATDGLEGKCV